MRAGDRLFSVGSRQSPGPQLTAAFRQGLQEIGFVERRNVAIEYRWAENQYDRLLALAAELDERRVAIIVATARANFAAKATPIPIVFANRGDRARDGQVTSLNRPGSNVTGVTVFAADLNEKHFGLFHDLVPQAAVIGVLSDTTNSNREIASQQVRAAAASGVYSGRKHRDQSRDRGRLYALPMAASAAVFVNNSFFSTV